MGGFQGDKFDEVRFGERCNLVHQNQAKAIGFSPCISRRICRSRRRTQGSTRCGLPPVSCRPGDPAASQVRLLRPYALCFFVVWLIDRSHCYAEIVVVTMQAPKEIPPDYQCKDKFLVQSITAEEGTTQKDIVPGMVNSFRTRVYGVSVALCIAYFYSQRVSCNANVVACIVQ